MCVCTLSFLLYFFTFLLISASAFMLMALLHIMQCSVKHLTSVTQALYFLHTTHCTLQKTKFSPTNYSTPKFMFHCIHTIQACQYETISYTQKRPGIVDLTTALVFPCIDHLRRSDPSVTEMCTAIVSFCDVCPHLHRNSSLPYSVRPVGS